MRILSFPGRHGLKASRPQQFVTGPSHGPAGPFVKREKPASPLETYWLPFGLCSYWLTYWLSYWLVVALTMPWLEHYRLSVSHESIGRMTRYLARHEYRHDLWRDPLILPLPDS